MISTFITKFKANRSAGKIRIRNVDDEFLLKFGITVVVVGHPCEEHAVRS